MVVVAVTAQSDGGPVEVARAQSVASASVQRSVASTQTVPVRFSAFLQTFVFGHTMA